MANKYTKTFPITEEDLRRDYVENNMSQLEIVEKYSVSLKIVQRLMRDYGIKPRKAAKRNQYGVNNSYWKGGRVIDNSGYVLVKCDTHPRAKTCGGYVPEHILVMEKHLGRYLKYSGANDPNGEVVHHINEDKKDNRIENLQLMTVAEHAKYHKNYLLATKARWSKCQRS